MVVALLLNGWRERMQKSRDFKTALRLASSEMQGDIELGSSWTANWDQPAVKSLADELEALGFRRIGAYGVESFAGLEVYPLHALHAEAFAVVFRLPSTGTAWFELFGNMPDGRLLSVVSSPAMGGLPSSPGVLRVPLWSVRPKVAFGVFSRERLRLGGGVGPTPESDFELLFRRSMEVG